MFRRIGGRIRKFLDFGNLMRLQIEKCMCVNKTVAYVIHIFSAACDFFVSTVSFLKVRYPASFLRRQRKHTAWLWSDYINYYDCCKRLTYKQLFESFVFPFGKFSPSKPIIFSRFSSSIRNVQGLKRLVSE